MRSREYAHTPTTTDRRHSVEALLFVCSWAFGTWKQAPAPVMSIDHGCVVAKLMQGSRCPDGTLGSHIH
eukprot:m.137806 g.137806  ORF g.137806 m.137806 type:complete len:69 (+) comp17583_c0_seq38:228-434(+)